MNEHNEILEAAQEITGFFKNLNEENLKRALEIINTEFSEEITGEEIRKNTDK